MRTLWAILLGGLAFIGTAEARLGETEEECRSRYKILKDMNVEKLADPKKYFARYTFDVRRDTFVVLIFDRETEKCVRISHNKDFKMGEEMNLPFRAAEGILEDNFGESLGGLKRRKIDHPNKKWDVSGSEDREYSAGWESADGKKTAHASSRPDANGGYNFYVTCESDGFFSIQRQYIGSPGD